MKILIAGSDINALLTAKYIKIQNEESDIYVTAEAECNDGSYTLVNIKESDIASICDFVKYNQIEFSIVTSPLAIINGISDIFHKEDFPVFAPYSKAAGVTFSNSAAKKMMYKLKINTPKFGIFDRENVALEHIRNFQFPVVIKKDFKLFSAADEIYNTFPKAKAGLKKLFENGNERIIIENYIDSPVIYAYFITDGYNALPLISLEQEEKEDFTLISAPSNKLSENMIYAILKNVIYPLLDDIEKFGGKYTGILGLKIKVSGNNYYVLEFCSKFQNFDFQTFISLSEENFLNLLYECTCGDLAGIYNGIRLKESYSCTVVLNKNQINEDIEADDDFTESEISCYKAVTCAASTLNYAKERLSGFLDVICKKNTANHPKKSIFL